MAEHVGGLALTLCLLLGLLLGALLRVSFDGIMPQGYRKLSSVSSLPSAPAPTEIPKEKIVSILLEMWSTSSYLAQNGSQLTNVPRPPHMENCRERVLEYSRLDTRSEDGQRPRWTLWKGPLGVELGKHIPAEDNGEKLLMRNASLLQGPLPPWVAGADEDNLPMTRRVQHDLWLHQHPRNCRDPSLKFLFIDFLRDPFFGTGAQLMAIAGMLAVAVNENRVFVLDYYNRADHEGCEGSVRSSWACYFVPETSKECRERALELAASQEARNNGTITDRNSYNDRMQWDTPIPELWGKPWEHQQPTMQVNGELVIHHSEEHRWWWRSQAWRYMMRYPSEYLCTLLNRARHEAFGAAAAAIVAETLPKEWPEGPHLPKNETAMQELVWSSHIHRPWVPRPLLSIHVRQGDKSGEMQLYNFDTYMALAQSVRDRFPHVQHVWLSTEMQNVVDESKNYTGWKFYFTNVPRQTGTTSMTEYETTLGRLRSSNNAFVNLMMAAESDYFVGTLGSTWGTVIEGLRTTGGKTFAGILSVNPGMYWV